MNPTTPDERRDSFRVKMTALVSVTPNTGELLNASEYFPELHAMALRSESNNIDQEIGLVSERIKDLATKKTIDLLKQKISLLEKLSDIQTIREQALKYQEIDISEGGCSIESFEQLKQGDTVVVALIFSPSYFSLFTFAQIIKNPNSERENRYHLSFSEMKETQKQNLVKHMFQAQTAENRESSNS